MAYGCIKGLKSECDGCGECNDSTGEFVESIFEEECLLYEEEATDEEDSMEEIRKIL